ncbi:SIS domain-containing protein [bacterium]|nr:SIS domain-containing protein [bacterium]
MFSKRIENFKKLNKMQEDIMSACEIIKTALKSQNKILLCGNGGSASDSNHIAAEFISRFQKDRASIPAVSLSANNSIITAIANDYSFEDVFSRQIEGLGNKNDVLIAISTSGKSKNIIKAIEKAKKQGLKVILLTGINKTKIEVDLEINTPSDVTCEIQEMHIAIAHVICEMVENDLF